MLRNMPFDEKIKKEVKERAAFRCCVCQEIGSIEAHHIIPQEHKGRDILENAAPLCPSCHAKYGDNPKKRKEIKQMRDWWYKKVEDMFPDNKEPLKLLEQVNSKLDNLQNNNSQMTDLKESLKKLSDLAIDKMTSGTAQITASNVVGSSSASLSNVRFEELSKMIWCKDCGEPIWISKPSDLQCYHCGYFNSGED